MRHREGRCNHTVHNEKLVRRDCSVQALCFRVRDGGDLVVSVDGAKAVAKFEVFGIVKFPRARLEAMHLGGFDALSTFRGQLNEVGDVIVSSMGQKDLTVYMGFIHGDDLSAVNL